MENWLPIIMLFKSSIALLIFCSSVTNKYVKVSNYNCELLISIFNSIIFRFIYFEALLLGTNTFGIVTSFWWIYSFIINEMYLFFLEILFLKFTLSHIKKKNKKHPSLFWLFACYILYHHFTFSLFVSLYLQWVSCR